MPDQAPQRTVPVVTLAGSAVAELGGVRPMSEVASITFSFDGTDREFCRLHEATSDLALDIGAQKRGTTGVIEFMISNFAIFREQVARRSAELGIELVAHDHLLDESKT